MKRSSANVFLRGIHTVCDLRAAVWAQLYMLCGNKPHWTQWNVLVLLSRCVGLQCKSHVRAKFQGMGLGDSFLCAADLHLTTFFCGSYNLNKNYFHSAAIFYSCVGTDIHFFSFFTLTYDTFPAGYSLIWILWIMPWAYAKEIVSQLAWGAIRLSLIHFLKIHPAWTE